MAFVTDRDRQAIRDAIGAAEAKTRGEIVCAIAGASDDYRYIPTLWAAALALALPLPALFHLGDITPHVYVGQLVLFLALALAARWTPLKMLLVPGRVKRARAAARARLAFLDLGVTDTADRAGILIFVSVAERHVEVIADRGIHAKVGNEAWQRAVDGFVAEIKAGRVGDGFLAAIDACGDVLERHFPRTGGEVDELPNRLYEF